MSVRGVGVRVCGVGVRVCGVDWERRCGLGKAMWIGKGDVDSDECM